MTPTETNRRVNDAAEALGKARRIHESRPDDAGAYRAYLEARVALLEAELAVRDRTIATERRRSMELGKLLRKAKALLTTAVKPPQRRRQNCDAALPLLKQLEELV